MTWIIFGAAALASIAWLLLRRALALGRASRRLEHAHLALEKARAEGDTARAEIEVQRSKDASMAVKRLRLW